jgi:enamine deaminase RidA (YjgF/YER057c/UK114 family)
MRIPSFSVSMIFVAASLLAPSQMLAQDRFPDPPRENASYADAVRVGDLVFLSGVVSSDPDPATQFRRIFERIGRILGDAGSSLDRVIEITTYHVGMHDHIDLFMEVKSEFMPNLPSWTAVGVTELYSGSALVEVKVIAAVGDER